MTAMPYARGRPGRSAEGAECGVEGAISDSCKERRQSKAQAKFEPRNDLGGDHLFWIANDPRREPFVLDCRTFPSIFRTGASEALPAKFPLPLLRLFVSSWITLLSYAIDA